MEQGKRESAVNVKTVTLLTPLSETGKPMLGDRETLCFLSRGVYSEENGMPCVTYTENEGDAAVRTVLRMLPDRSVTLCRSGGVTASIHFVLGETTESVYEIPPASFSLAVTLKHAVHTLKDARGSLRLSYEMILGGAASEVAFCLSITPEEVTA